MDKEKLEKFVKEYQELCKKYKMEIRPGMQVVDLIAEKEELNKKQEQNDVVGTREDGVEKSEEVEVTEDVEKDKPVDKENSEEVEEVEEI
jgi:hypothetical protein